MRIVTSHRARRRVFMSGVARWLVAAHLASRAAASANVTDSGAYELVPRLAQDGGTLDREVLRTVVCLRLDDLRRCYQAELVWRRKVDGGPTTDRQAHSAVDSRLRGEHHLRIASYRTSWSQRGLRSVRDRFHSNRALPEAQARGCGNSLRIRVSSDARRR